MVCSPAKVVSTSPWTRRCITSLINAVFGSAKDWTRDAKFTASPRTVTCASAPSWTFPTTAAPVFKPDPLLQPHPVLCFKFRCSDLNPLQDGQSRPAGP